MIAILHENDFREYSEFGLLAMKYMIYNLTNKDKCNFGLIDYKKKNKLFKEINNIIHNNNFTNTCVDISFIEVEITISACSTFVIKYTRNNSNDICFIADSIDRKYAKIIISDKHAIGYIMHLFVGMKSDIYWGINPQTFNNIIDDVNIIDCFSSPFNHYSQNYFSLFEGDEIYGSKGNFIDKFKDYYEHEISDKPLLYTINPPFVESLVKDAIKYGHDKFESSINSKNIIMIFYLPPWNDILYTDNDSLISRFKKDKYIVHDFCCYGKIYSYHTESCVDTNKNLARMFIIYSNKSLTPLCNTLINNFIK